MRSLVRIMHVRLVLGQLKPLYLLSPLARQWGSDGGCRICMECCVLINWLVEGILVLSNSYDSLICDYLVSIRHISHIIHISIECGWQTCRSLSTNESSNFRNNTSLKQQRGLQINTADSNQGHTERRRGQICLSRQRDAFVCIDDSIFDVERVRWIFFFNGLI